MGKCDGKNERTKKKNTVDRLWCHFDVFWMPIMCFSYICFILHPWCTQPINGKCARARIIWINQVTYFRNAPSTQQIRYLLIIMGCQLIRNNHKTQNFTNERTAIGSMKTRTKQKNELNNNTEYGNRMIVFVTIWQNSRVNRKTLTLAQLNLIFPMINRFELLQIVWCDNTHSLNCWNNNICSSIFLIIWHEGTFTCR